MAKKIGKRLKEARQETGLTQEDVGAALGIGRAAYANIETGRSLLTIDHLLKLPSILSKPVTYFLEVQGSMSPREEELLQLYRDISPEMLKQMVFNLVKSTAEQSRNGSYEE